MQRASMMALSAANPGLLPLAVGGHHSEWDKACLGIGFGILLAVLLGVPLWLLIAALNSEQPMQQAKPATMVIYSFNGYAVTPVGATREQFEVSE